METNNELNEMLADVKYQLEQDFSQEKIDRLEVDEIKRQMSRFKTAKVDSLIREIDHLSEVIKSPVHVGMLGRYSHGKTALVNKLFSLDEECKLPEGDGVVTSKVTYVSFDKELPVPEAYEVKKGGGENLIDLTVLRNSVGRTDHDTSTIDYYKLRLPTEGKDFASLFASKNINLVDMPGLGGPYFKDQTITKKYIRNLDMIIAVIKIDEILESGLHVNNLIENSLIPIIPVLTFTDKWKESDLYSDCKDIDAVLFKAQKLIEENIPNLRPFLGNIIAVSSYTGDNIDALRNLILNHIESANIAIGRARKDISPVYRKQLILFKEEYSAFKAKMAALEKDLDEMLKPILPKNGELRQDIIEEACKGTRVLRAKHALEDETARCVNDFFAKYKDRLSSIQYVNKKDELVSAISKLEDDTNNRLARESTERMDSLYQSYKDELSYEINKLLSRMTLDNKTKANLNKGISDAMEDSAVDYQDSLKLDIKSVAISSCLAKYDAKVGMSFIANMAKNPVTLIMCIAGVAIFVAGLCAFRRVNNGLMIAGIALAVASIIPTMLSQPRETKALFDEAKQSVINLLKGAFDVNKKKDNLLNVVSRTVLELNQDLKDVLSDDTSSYNKDARFMTSIKERFDEKMNQLSDKLEDELCKISHVQ